MPLIWLVLAYTFLIGLLNLNRAQVKPIISLEFPKLGAYLRLNSLKTLYRDQLYNF